jgi:hypothetical protein
MRIPYQTLQAAKDVADVKAAATGRTWYVNRLASSGPMRYEAANAPITDTSFGAGVVYTASPAPLADREVYVTSDAIEASNLAGQLVLPPHQVRCHIDLRLDKHDCPFYVVVVEAAEAMERARAVRRRMFGS